MEWPDQQRVINFRTGYKTNHFDWFFYLQKTLRYSLLFFYFNDNGIRREALLNPILQQQINPPTSPQPSSLSPFAMLSHFDQRLAL
jgi:hypothetical protein